MGEIAELESLAEFIDPGDVELLEAAGVPEYPESSEGDTITLTVPAQVVEPEEHTRALAALTAIAEAYEAGGWDFMAAATEAHQTAGVNA